MLLLSDPSKRDRTIKLLKELVDEYRCWIKARTEESSAATFPYRDAAQRHIAACSDCAVRMEFGISLLETNHTIYTAFRLANEAVLLQQIQSKQKVRTATFNDQSTGFDLDPPYSCPHVNNLKVGQGRWRPFQISFLLLSLTCYLCWRLRSLLSYVACCNRGEGGGSSRRSTRWA